MLEPRIEVTDLSKDARIITLRDITGSYDSVTNPNGYNLPNLSRADIEGIIVQVSAYGSPTVNSVHYVREPDINHPEYLTTPAVQDILSGYPIQITTLHLGITAPQDGIKAFNDGVIDINYYVYEYATPVVGVAGNPYVIAVDGANLQNIFDYDSVLIEGELYQIDHSKPTNGGTILWLTEDLKVDTNELNAALRANTKAFNDTHLRCGYQSAYAKFSKGCNCKGHKDLVRKLNEIMHMDFAAKLDYMEEDYAGCNELLAKANKVIKFLDCKC